MRAFYSYFLTYLFHAKTRQGLLFLALAGLFLSSLALMVIQGVMGGLQNGLVARSKSYYGVGVARFSTDDPTLETELWQKAQALKWNMARELSTEVLARQGAYVAPLVIHGIDTSGMTPEYLKKRDTSGLVLGADVAQKLRTRFFGDVMLIAPGVTESLMGEIPRQVSVEVTDYVVTEVMELDGMHAWTRLPVVQNLLRFRGADRWRFFSEEDFAAARDYLKDYSEVRLESWKDQHSTLVWALNLETRVMLGLFTAMALLVALAITTGLLLFFSKIRKDLASFWLLGLSLKKLQRLVLGFVIHLSLLTCSIGVILGMGILWALETYGHTLMPDIFVERSFPIQINLLSVSVSFCIPFLISVVFSLLSFLQFRQENSSFIQLVRATG